MAQDRLRTLLPMKRPMQSSLTQQTVVLLSGIRPSSTGKVSVRLIWRSPTVTHRVYR